MDESPRERRRREVEEAREAYRMMRDDFGTREAREPEPRRATEPGEIERAGRRSGTGEPQPRLRHPLHVPPP